MGTAKLGEVGASAVSWVWFAENKIQFGVSHQRVCVGDTTQTVQTKSGLITVEGVQAGRQSNLDGPRRLRVQKLARDIQQMGNSGHANGLDLSAVDWRQ